MLSTFDMHAGQDYNRHAAVFMLQVCLEMVKPEVPDDTTVGFSLEFVWKATSFERMNIALKLFKDYSASISGYLFHVLLGHEVSWARHTGATRGLAPVLPAQYDGSRNSENAQLR